MSGIWRFRAAALTLLGALAVHQGRYLFATHQREHEAAAGHAYLGPLLALAGVLAFLGVVQLLGRLGREHGSARSGLPRGRVLWTVSSVVLLSVFLGQESLETALSHGYVPELSDLLGGGGWTAIPFSVLVGALIALLLRGAAAVVGWARRRRLSVARRPVPALLSPCSPELSPSGSVLARRLAGRGPPALS